MNKTKPVLFYRVVIFLSCIILSWGFAKFALFTQHEFRELIKWGNRYDYEVDWAQKTNAPDGEGTEIKKEKVPKDGQRVKWGQGKVNKVSDSVGKALKNKKGIFATIIITMLIVGIVFRYIKKRQQKKKTEAASTLRLMRQVEKEKSTHIESTAEEIAIYNEIRQELIQWEKRLYEHKRRKPYETMQQWFRRIDKSPSIIPIYENVRYGEKDYSVSELEMVRCWVKE